LKSRNYATRVTAGVHSTQYPPNSLKFNIQQFPDDGDAGFAAAQGAGTRTALPETMLHKSLDFSGAAGKIREEH
jgi:hypothetical protein